MRFFALFPATLLLFTPLFLIGARKLSGKKAKKVLFANIAVFFGLLVIAGATGISGAAYATGAAEEAAAASAGMSEGLRYISAALAVGLSGIGGGVAVAAAASAALGAISENDSVFGKSLIFVGLAEGVALYGLIVALLLIFMV